MAVDIEGILGAVVSHAMASGHFEKVNGHEPKAAPGKGLTAAVWVQAIAPVPRGSGLATTTGRIELRDRIYTPMVQEPQDAIDPAVLTATIDLMGAYSGDFTLDGRIRNVDLLGQAGVPLSAQAGYLNQDGRLFRVMDITLPLIVNDIWDQAP
jgi:hypothetical protein